MSEQIGFYIMIYVAPWRKKGTEKGLTFSLLCIFSTDHNCV